MKSWKTTALGITTIITAVSAAVTQFVQGGFAAVSFEVLITTVMIGVGLIFAKDSAVTGGTIAATPEAAKRVGG